MNQEELTSQARTLVAEWNPEFHLADLEFSDHPSGLAKNFDAKTCSGTLGGYSTITKKILLSDAIDTPSALAVIWVHESQHANDDAAGVLDINKHLEGETRAYNVDWQFHQWYEAKYGPITGAGSCIFEQDEHASAAKHYGVIDAADMGGGFYALQEKASNGNIDAVVALRAEAGDPIAQMIIALGFPS